jgi:hypothetical protein
MSDPRRLLDEGANDFEAKLLRAGRRDAPSHRNRRRVLVGLGLGSVLSASAAASAGGTKFLSTGALNALRWVGGGAVSALAVWTAVEVSAPTPAKVNQPSSQSAGARQASTQPAAPSPSVSQPMAVPEDAPTSVPAASTELSSSAKPPSPMRGVGAVATQDRAEGGLSAELAALDRARGALTSGDAGLTLRLLDDYGQRFPKRRLSTEAAVLRIEALSARGDQAGAARLGKEFLARQPNGPYARRVRSLIAEPAPSAKAER